MKKTLEEKLLDIFRSSLPIKIITDQYNGAEYEEQQDSIDTNTFKKDVIPKIMNLLCSLRLAPLQLKTNEDMQQYRNWKMIAYGNNDEFKNTPIYTTLELRRSVAHGIDNMPLCDTYNDGIAYLNRLNQSLIDSLNIVKYERVETSKDKEKRLVHLINNQIYDREHTLKTVLKLTDEEIDELKNKQ